MSRTFHRPASTAALTVTRVPGTPPDGVSLARASSLAVPGDRPYLLQLHAHLLVTGTPMLVTSALTREDLVALRDECTRLLER
jgi:hypothetical protein